MKKLTSVILAICFLILPVSVMAGGAEESAVPEEVRTYAEETALPNLISWYEEELSGFRGGLIETEGGVSGLKLGGGRRAFALLAEGFDPNSPETLATPLNEWIFSADTPKGEMLALFTVSEHNGVLCLAEVMDAGNLAAAFEVMKALAEKAGCEFAPELLRFRQVIAVRQSFGGDERIITVPTDETELNGDYYKVSEYYELPTLDEFVEEWQRRMDEYASVDLIDLAPHLGASAPTAAPVSTEEPAAATEAPAETGEPADDAAKKEETPKRTAAYLLPIAAACVIAALLAAVALRKKK